MVQIGTTETTLEPRHHTGALNLVEEAALQIQRKQRKGMAHARGQIKQVRTTLYELYQDLLENHDTEEGAARELRERCAPILVRSLMAVGVRDKELAQKVVDNAIEEAIQHDPD